MALTNGTLTENGHHKLKKRKNKVENEINNNVNTTDNKKQRNKSKSPPAVAKCFSRDGVPKFMWEPGILTGYRASGQPWSYYLRSLFWIHNESCNIWSHLLAPVIMAVLLYGFSQKIDFSTDVSAHGLLVFAVTATISFLCSAAAHLLHAKGEFQHYLLFSIDYIGIALYGYGYGIMVYYCSGNELFYSTLGPYFPLIHALLASNITLCNIIARTRYKNLQCPGRKVLQVISCSTSVIFCELVILFRLYAAERHGISITYSYHMYQVFFSVTNGLLFSMHQPERAYPGKFDIWGHGHQWFHLSVICCATSQLFACYEDLLILPRPVLEMAEPEIGTIWGSLLAVIALNIATYLAFVPKLRNLVKH